MKYDLVIFDMDGTILNTLEDLADSLNATLRHFHYPEHTIGEVCSFVGNGIRLLIERGVPKGLEVSEIDKVHAYFMTYYQEHCADKTKPYDGIHETIQKLREAGIKTAVVSNKADCAVKELAEQYFEGMFDVAVGEREGILKKPAPDGVNDVLRQLGVARDRAIYVGESEVDVATAQNAQMDSLIVEWGFRKADFLKEHGAKLLISDPKEIVEYCVQQ